MAKGDSATVGIGALKISTYFFGPCQNHRGKGFVDLKGVDLINGQTGTGQECLSGIDGAGQHQNRVHANEAGVHNAGAWGETKGRSLFFGHHQQRSGAIRDLRGVAGGMYAVLTGNRL